MNEDKQFFKIPLEGDESAYNFGVTNEDQTIYEELNAINEEIEQCRLRNC